MEGENFKAGNKKFTHIFNSKVGTKSQPYMELKMSKYLCPNDYMSLNTSKFVAKTQCHMIETVKTNFKHEFEPNLLCNSCKVKECNQSHLLYCSALIGSNQRVTYIPNYEDIFNDEVTEELNFIAHIIMANLKRKKDNKVACSLSKVRT